MPRRQRLDRGPTGSTPSRALRGSISIAFEHADVSVPEIERLAGDERWVQVIIPGSAELPLGNRKYWPIYEAAAAAGMPVAIHTGGIDMHRGSGWPSYYLEEHVWNGNAMAATVLSLICEGTFERFPDLQVVCVEAGISWAAALQWSLDAAWETLRDDAARSSARRRRRSASTSGSRRSRSRSRATPPTSPARCGWSAWTTGSCSPPTTRTGTSTRPARRCRARSATSCAAKILGANAARLYRLGVEVAA